MSVSYTDTPAETSKPRKVGREFALRRAFLPSKADSVEAAASPKSDLAKPSSAYTPSPSAALFSMGDFSINEADQFRQLMHVSLTSFAAGMETQVALTLLKDDVVRLCGEKSQRIMNRVNSRHGMQPEFVIPGDQKVAIPRPGLRSLDNE